MIVIILLFSLLESPKSAEVDQVKKKVKICLQSLQLYAPGVFIEYIMILLLYSNITVDKSRSLYICISYLFNYTTIMSCTK